MSAATPRWEALALAMPLLLSGCVRASVSRIYVQPAVLKSALRFQKEYLLVPGDQIEVAVRRAPEVSRTVVIRSDGNISLPLLQDVHAAGSAPRELAADLRRRFAARLVDPEVAVIPTQVRPMMVYVVGDVNSPAAVPFRDAPTAMQAISLAGGLKRSGSAGDVTIIRLGQDGYLRAMMVTPDIGGQPGPYMALRATPLQPDDVVFIPESGRSQVARFLDDFVTRPLGAIAGALGIYVNFRLIEKLN
jgi:protein involved in polysaccharide export with SLBB domain